MSPFFQLTVIVTLAINDYSDETAKQPNITTKRTTQDTCESQKKRSFCEDQKQPARYNCNFTSNIHLHFGRCFHPHLADFSLPQPTNYPPLSLTVHLILALATHRYGPKTHVKFGNDNCVFRYSLIYQIRSTFCVFLSICFSLFIERSLRFGVGFVGFIRCSLCLSVDRMGFVCFTVNLCILLFESNARWNKMHAALFTRIIISSKKRTNWYFHVTGLNY